MISNRGRSYPYTPQDFLFSPDNIICTPWKKKFVFRPKVSVNGRKIWLSFAYHRVCKTLVDIPVLPVGALIKHQWATEDELILSKLKGEI